MSSGKLVKYIQGANKTDKKMYCLIGKFAISAKVHNELGVAVTGNDGDAWYFWFDLRDNPYGFCNVRYTKDNQCHVRLLYAEAMETTIKNELLTWVIDDAIKAESLLVFTNDRENNGFWKLFNFVPGEKKRGTFVRWEKKL